MKNNTQSKEKKPLHFDTVEEKNEHLDRRIQFFIDNGEFERVFGENWNRADDSQSQIVTAS
jgi:hypothetical protein